MQSMSDDPVSSCKECRAPVDRVFRPVAVHFKGSGFYTTDYGRGRGGGGGDSSSDSTKADKEAAGAKSDSKGESSKKSGESADSKKSDTGD
jgi:predicted nucleic acid-binding Zn ribbon protein